MTTPKLSYSRAEAAAATGLSVDVIGRAIKAGDLAVIWPQIDGRRIAKPVIPADALARWLAA